MASCALKKIFPSDLLIAFLEPICSKTPEYYVVNYESYRRAMFTSHYRDFLEQIRPYYHSHRLYFIDREILYKNFLTTLRQICTFNEIPYRHIREFNHSKSKTTYHIHLCATPDPATPDPATPDPATPDPATPAPLDDA